MTVPLRSADLDALYRDVPAVVCGGSGFIGAWVVRALVARGARVHVVVRDAARAQAALPNPSRQVGLRVADLARPGEATRALDALQPAVVFNLAGYGVDRAERDPAIMTALNDRLVLELATCQAPRATGQWSGMHLVHVGSALEYGPIRGRLHESSTPRPTTDYGRSKLAGTRHIVRSSEREGTRALVARLFTVYGPGEHPGRLLPSLQAATASGGAVPLSPGRQRRDFTYVEDVAEGLVRLAVSGVRPGEVVNLASGRLTSVREFAETAASVLGLGAQSLQFGALPERPDEMWHDEVDVARLRELTGWVPETPIREGIRRAWEFEHVA
jgi:nucleoside-diphosphate-sugar epimerase